MADYQNTIQGQPQPKFRDRLFIAIFGKDTERSKRWRLDLYNVLYRKNSKSAFCRFLQRTVGTPGTLQIATVGSL